MKVADISKLTSLSLEMFPPKKPESLPKFIDKASKMASLNPDFISVTYGAGGGTKATTLELAKAISKTTPVTAHLNCDGLTEEGLDAYLAELKKNSIENVLALRGDYFDSKEFNSSVHLIKAIKNRGDFCVGSACYPEKHPESLGLEADMEFYRRKIFEGCEFFITQMCFDTKKIIDFVHKFHKATGFEAQIRVGIMPILKEQTVDKALSLGVSVPEGVQYIVKNTFEGRPEFIRNFGIDYCSRQIKELLEAGVTNIHLYTMNDFEATKQILKITEFPSYKTICLN